jgi:hypothetical protein
MVRVPVCSFDWDHVFEESAIADISAFGASI